VLLATDGEPGRRPGLAVPAYTIKPSAACRGIDRLKARVKRCIFLYADAIMSRRVVYETSLVIFLCVLSLFLFPAPSGPYPAVHGPATALRVGNAWSQISAVMEQALHSFASSHIFVSNVAGPLPAVFDNEPPLVTWHGTKDILRC
jgi:hypothetical protein